MVRQRVRIRFGKQGDLRLIGHRDLVRCLERLFRRAGVKLEMSRGFHPKPRMTFPSALALGIEGVDEVMEVCVADIDSADQLLRRLVSHAPAGLTIRSLQVLPQGTRKCRVRQAGYRMAIPPQRRPDLAPRIDRLLARSSCPVKRPNRRAALDLRPLLDALTLRQGVLEMRLRTANGATTSPRDVLAALGLQDLEQQGVYLTRTVVEIDP